jgi:uncharacterized membrane protein
MKDAGQKEAHAREFLFHYGVLGKGMFAFVEALSGSALWIFGTGPIVKFVDWLTQYELSQDPHDLVANALHHGASRLSIGGEHFAALYLLIHGVVKLLLIVALLRNKLWAYPISLLVFGGFVVYQVCRYDVIGGVGLILLTALDLFVIWMIWLEYRAVLAHKVEHTTPAER